MGGTQEQLVQSNSEIQQDTCQLLGQLALKAWESFLRTFGSAFIHPFFMKGTLVRNHSVFSARYCLEKRGYLKASSPLCHRCSFSPSCWCFRQCSFLNFVGFLGSLLGDFTPLDRSHAHKFFRLSRILSLRFFQLLPADFHFLLWQCPALIEISGTKICIRHLSLDNKLYPNLA